MTGRGMRRRGLGHSSAAADCLVPHSLAQHSPPRRPPAPLPNAHGLPVGWLRSPLRQRGNRTPTPPGSGGAAAARRREKEGEAAGCSGKREAPTGKPWASRPCQCPRLAVGIVTFAAPPSPARPARKCPRLARGIVTFAATSARQSNTPSAVKNSVVSLGLTSSVGRASRVHLPIHDKARCPIDGQLAAFLRHHVVQQDQQAAGLGRQFVQRPPQDLSGQAVSVIPKQGEKKAVTSHAHARVFPIRRKIDTLQETRISKKGRNQPCERF